MKKAESKRQRGSSIAAFFLCLALAVGCLSGCGGNKEQPSQSKETQQSSESAQQSETEGEEEMSPLPLVPPGEEATLNIGFIKQANIEDYETNDLTKWLEEQTGVNIEFTFFDSGQMATQLSLMMADPSAKLPDILIHNVSNLPIVTANQYGEDGYLINLRPYLESEDAYFFNKWKEEYTVATEAELKDAMMSVTDVNNDEIYLMPAGGTNPYMDVLVADATINGKFLDTIGAEVPTTIDELCDVLRKIRDEDPNGNGKADEVPLLGSHEWKSDIAELIVNAYVYDNPDFFFNVTDGKVWIPYATDEYRQAMIKLNEMYKEGLISPLYTTADNATMAAIYTPEDGVPICGVMGGHILLKCFNSSELIKDFKPLPFLKGETDKGGYAAMEKHFVTNTLGSITEDCEDPELAFRFLDYFGFDLETLLRRRYGPQDVAWRWAEEGELDASGNPATYSILPSELSQATHNYTWGGLAEVSIDLERTNFSFADDGSVSSMRTRINSEAYSLAMEMPRPEELIFSLPYNDEEQEVIADYLGTLKSYVISRRDMFMVGELDPNDDAVWKEYVDAVEGQGANEVIAAAQSAYDRSLQ